ncbi:MAG: hypothetical protein R6V32_09840, partial [Bacteroidales bacterium]
VENCNGVKSAVNYLTNNNTFEIKGSNLIVEGVICDDIINGEGIDKLTFYAESISSEQSEDNMYSILYNGYYSFRTYQGLRTLNGYSKVWYDGNKIGYIRVGTNNSSCRFDIRF